MRLKRFLHWFHRYRELHLPISLIVFIATIYGTDRFLTDTAEILLWTWNGIYLGLWAVFFLARQFYNPIPASARRRHILDVFTTLPPFDTDLAQAPGRQRHRVRRIQTHTLSSGAVHPDGADLETFVGLSEEALSDAHPDLETHRRRVLYERWWARNHDAFLLLEKGDGVTWQPVAISIVLPLTDSGRDDLENGITPVLGLSSGDIAGPDDKYGTLLIDTFIVVRSERRSFAPYAFALVLRHLALYWDPSKQANMTIILEPDVRSVQKLATICRFRGPLRSADGGKLYSYDFGKDRADQELTLRFEQISENLGACRSWPLG